MRSFSKEKGVESDLVSGCFNVSDLFRPSPSSATSLHSQEFMPNDAVPSGGLLQATILNMSLVVIAKPTKSSHVELTLQVDLDSRHNSRNNSSSLWWSRFCCFPPLKFSWSAEPRKRPVHSYHSKRFPLLINFDCSPGILFRRRDLRTVDEKTLPGDDELNEHDSELKLRTSSSCVSRCTLHMTRLLVELLVLYPCINSGNVTA